MTVRVTTLKGLDAGAYYVEGLPSYYLDGDEPPGRWLGEAAESLGLAGEVGDDDFLAVMAGRHPVTGDHLGRRYGEASVRGFDVTASAPKSVSVLFALGDDHVRGAVLDGHDATVAALAGWVEGRAHTRYRIDGQVVIVDAQGIMGAAFRQHVSRSLEPHLHSHLVIPNRVLAPDGRYLALDARTIKCDQRTLSALYHSGLRAELTRRLGVQWQGPVNGIAEIEGMPAELLSEFSSRAKAVAERTEEKLERFTENFGRDPTPRERWRLEREAVIDSRPAKAHGTDAESLRQDWAERTIALGHDPEQVVSAATGIQPPQHQMDLFAEELIAVHALDALVERQSAWRPAEVVRELAAAVPTDTDMSANDLMAWIDGMAETVTARSLVELSAPIPAGVALRRDGRPVTEAVTARALTTPDVLAQEELVLDWAERRLADGGMPGAGVVLRASELSGPQLDLAAAVAGDAALVLAVGPAGSGKTTALAPAVEELVSHGRKAFGVAPSAVAAEVLAGTGMVTDTLDKLLVEHRHGHTPGHPYDLGRGATVILDEASMVSTPKLAELANLADRQGWRVVMVGDPLQFSAVGRGGMFAHMVQTCGAIELDRVRRFANPWERDASLRLRQGDVSVLDLYDAHGRLHGGSARRMESAVVNAWWQAHQRGESVAMMAPTNEAVTALNRRAQALRVSAGEIDFDGPALELGDQHIHVGDHVATRRNDRRLRTDRGAMVRNRDRWRVTAIHADGRLALAGRSGKITLPADYARAHVELAYAQTAHGVQGRTVDRAFVLLDGPSDARGVYVPMTRGRLSNEAFVVVAGEGTAVDVMADAMARDWVDRPAVVRRAELARGRGASVEASTRAIPLGPFELRRLLEDAHARARLCERERWDLDRLSRDRDRATDRRDYLERSLDDSTRRRDNALDEVNRLDRPLRRRHHRHDIANWTNIAQAAQVSIDRDEAELAALAGSIPALEAGLAQARLVQRYGPVIDDELAAMKANIEADLVARASRYSLDQPDDLVERLGPRLTRSAEANAWDRAAARINQHHAAFGITDSADGFGHRPGWGDTAQDLSHRAVTQACEQLDRAVGRELEIEAPGLSL